VIHISETQAQRTKQVLRDNAPEFWEIKKMRKTILTVVGAALIAASAVSMASAAERHQRYHRAPVGLSDQVRNSNAYVAPTIAVQPEWPGYGYGDGYYSHGFSAPAGR
jgi:hypothetical protein